MALKQLHLRLRDRGRLLATRQAGRDVARALQDHWQEPVVLHVNFADVEAITPPFLDELFKALYAELETHEGSLVLARGMNEDVFETTKMVLDRKNRSLAYCDEEDVDLLTEIPNLAETFAVAKALPNPFKAGDLAEALKIGISNTNQRLSALSKVGAVSRERDPEAERGLRYLYLVVGSELPDKTAEPEAVPLPSPEALSL